MSVESLTNNLIKIFQSESDAFYYIGDALSHSLMEKPDSMTEGCVELAWQRHAALEALIVKYKSLLEEK